MHSVESTYSDIQEQLSSGSMQDLHQVPDTFLPDVEGMLPCWTSHNVLTIPWETASLPWSPEQITDSIWKTF